MIITMMVFSLLSAGTRIAAKSLQQWRAGKDLKEEPTAVIPGLYKQSEVQRLIETQSAEEAKEIWVKAATRYQLAAQVLGMEGATS